MKTLKYFVFIAGCSLICSDHLYTQWIQTNGPYGCSVSSLTVSGSTIFMGDGSNLFRSTNNGASWTPINTPYTGFSILVVSGSSLYANSNAGIIRSTNNGTSWTELGLTGRSIRALVISGSNIFAGTDDGIYRSIDDGASWTTINVGLPTKNISALILSGTNLFAGNGDYKGIYLSTNNGASWTPVNTGLPTESATMALTVSGTNLFVALYGKGVFRSSNNGMSWTEQTSGLGNADVRTLYASGTNLYAGTMRSGAFLSTNNGESWVSIGLPKLNITAFAACGSNLFAGESYGAGIFISPDNGTSWSSANTGLTYSFVRALAVSGSNLYAGVDGRGAFVSADSGATWTEINTGLTSTTVHTFLVNGTDLFAGTNDGVFLSTNNGLNWTQINNGLASTRVYCLVFLGQYLFAGTAGGVFRTSDLGASWNAANIGLTGAGAGSQAVFSLATSGPNLFAATYNCIYFSSNNGASWTVANSGLNGESINNKYPLAANANYVFAGTRSGIYVTNNNGASWTFVNTSSTGYRDPLVWSLAFIGTNLFAGVNAANGIFISPDNGTSWIVDNGFVENMAPNAYALMGTKLYVGTWRGVWRRPISEMITLTAPTTPLLESPNEGAIGVATSPILCWYGSGGGVTYRVQVSTASNFSSVLVNQSGITQTSYSFIGLANNTTYYWRVNATNSAGTSLWSATRSFTTIPAMPGIPTQGLPVDGAIEVTTNPLLTWNPSDGAVSYQIQVSANLSFSPMVVNQSGITSTSLAITGLLSNSKYYWRVNASNTGGTSGWSSIYSFTTIKRPPIAPILVAPANGSTEVALNPTLSWNASSGATSYGLQVSTNSNFTTMIYDQTGLALAALPITGLHGNMTYYWRVNATNSEGTSLWSSVQNFTTMHAASLVSGKVVYDNQQANEIGSATVTLAPVTGTALTTISDEHGLFTFINIPSGSYIFGATKAGAWAGANSTDALHVVRNYAGLQTFDTLQTTAADVNNSGSVNATDALLIVQRFVGVTASFEKGDWVFESKAVTVGTTSMTNQTIKGLAVGDVNKSNVLSGTAFTKTAVSNVSVSTINSIEVAAMGTFSVPMTAVNEMTLGAVSLVMIYPADMVSFEGVSSTKLSGVIATANEGVIKIGWANMNARSEGVQIKEEEVLLVLNFTAKVDKGSVKVTTGTGSEFVDASGNMIALTKLSANSVEIGQVPSVFVLSQNYPNPFNPSTTFSFTLPLKSFVQLKIFDPYGREVGQVISDELPAGRYARQWNGGGLPSGMYFYRLQAGSVTETKKLLILK